MSKEVIFIEVADPNRPEQFIVDVKSRFENRGFDVRLIPLGAAPKNSSLDNIILRPYQKAARMARWV